MTSREEQAIDNIAATLEADSDLEPAEADCVATMLVEDRGVDDLIDDGLLTEDLHLVEDGQGNVEPGVLGDIFLITVDCLWDNRTASPSG